MTKVTKRQRQNDRVLKTIDSIRASIEIDAENTKASATTRKRNQSNIKKLESVTKQIEAMQDKPRKSNPNSGLMRELELVPGAKTFFGATTLSRPTATKLISEYIKANELQIPDQRRVIQPDDKLCALLNYNPAREEPLTFMTLQKFLSNIFVKAE